MTQDADIARQTYGHTMTTFHPLWGRKIILQTDQQVFMQKREFRSGVTIQCRMVSR